MIKKIFYNSIILFVVIIFLFSGCATLLTGTSDVVYVRSKPSNAEIYVTRNDLIKVADTTANLSWKGTTPSFISIQRSLVDKKIVVKKQSYKEKTVDLESRFNLFFLGNIIFFPGAIVDLLTGSIIYYPYKEYFIELEK